MNSVLKQFSLLSVLLGLLLFSFLSNPVGVKAQVKEFEYESIDVVMDVFEDSTVEVTEQITHRFRGTFRGVFREIKLEDRDNLDICKNNPALQCGGFEYIEILDVLDNEGRSLNPAEYTVEEVKSGGEDRLRVQWVFSPDGTAFNDELYSYTIKYKVYGSLGYFEDYDLVYWNAIFPDRNELVEKVNVRLNFPGDINFGEEDLKVLGKGFDYDASYSSVDSSLEITSTNLLPYEDFTILLKIPKKFIQKYATLDLKLSPSVQDVNVNGVQITGIADKLAGIPSGDTQLTFSAGGRESKDFQFDLAPGEVRELEVSLPFSRLMLLLIFIVVVCNGIGCLILPALLIWIYREWSTKGKDIGRRQTVIPLFSPPENIRPHLMGSIKDESADLIDITSTIIDAAFRGFIKIREFEAKTILGIKLTAKDYELIKLKDFSELTPTEQKILSGMFGSSERVTTSDLTNKFYKKLPGIKEAIYSEMLSRGYFSKRPDKVRRSYRTRGVIMIVIGVLLFFPNFLLPVFITFPFSLIIGGIVLTVAATYMPAKTKKGSKVLDEILGFRMYMYTAERFRVQDLTPETFEKYLAYAMVFGIEKEWGERFKDIYKEPPDWFEGSSFDSRTWSTIHLINALSNFNTVTSRSFVSSPSSSGSGWSGGGWSGGGGFSGGFSGGGGGGGGGGAF
ncbi:MAG: DUF2207 domain-containing protein [Candidatus Dojkabacteria bacterium]